MEWNEHGYTRGKYLFKIRVFKLTCEDAGEGDEKKEN